ncbi:MAG: sensor histidine kinase [Bacteriovorax sp.]
MKTAKPSSLKKAFQKLAIRWTIVSFVLTLLLSISCFVYISAELEQNRVSTLAQSVTRAFRPMILEKNIRDAQFQMKRVLDLKNGEYVVIRDPNFKTLYSPDRQDIPSTCRSSEKICFDMSGYITFLRPVYYDDDTKENLFGYVELKAKVQTNWGLLIFFILFLFLIFSIFIAGIFSTQSEIIGLLRETMKTWAGHLKESPSFKAPTGKAPFEELYPLESAISELHLEIIRLKENAAAEARFKTQVSILREISHDLKTPISQLAKFFSVHLARVERTGKVDVDIVNSINRSMNKLGDLVRQVETIGPQLNTDEIAMEITDIQSETKIFVEDFEKVCELELGARNIISLNLPADKLFASIPKAQYYRILDNLLRNALDATSNVSAHINVSVVSDGSRPTLIVSDNGCGIDQKFMENIFDAEFTTKPARGTGLGLSIVKKICFNFLADIKVESKSGLGSVFKISFIPSDLGATNFQSINIKDALI